MQKSRLGEYSYTILLSVSFIVVALLWQLGGLKEQKPDEISHFLQDATDDFFSWIMLEKSVEAVSVEVSGLDTGTDVLPGPGAIRVETVEDGIAKETGEVLPQGSVDGAGESLSAGGSDNENVSGMLETTETAPEFYHADVSYLTMHYL